MEEMAALAVGLHAIRSAMAFGAELPGWQQNVCSQFALQGSAMAIGAQDILVGQMGERPFLEPALGHAGRWDFRTGDACARRDVVALDAFGEEFEIACTHPSGALGVLRVAFKKHSFFKVLKGVDAAVAQG